MEHDAGKKKDDDRTADDDDHEHKNAVGDVLLEKAARHFNSGAALVHSAASQFPVELSRVLKARISKWQVGHRRAVK